MNTNATLSRRLGTVEATIIGLGSMIGAGVFSAFVPVAGGTYASGREQLGLWRGYFADWSFLVGTAASCAAMALVFAAYLAPAGGEKPVALYLSIGIVMLTVLGEERLSQSQAPVVDVLADVVIVGLSIIADLRGAIAFSSFGVLLYYFVANVSAFAQSAAQRRVPRLVNVCGAIVCMVLVVTVPVIGIVVRVVTLIRGIPVRLLSNRQSRVLFDHGT